MYEVVESGRKVICAVMMRLLAVAVAMVWLAQGSARAEPFRVLFIGNSHLFVNDVPARVRGRLLAAIPSVDIHTLAKGGARLAGYVGHPDVDAVLKRGAWDVVVLQEASASFLSDTGRQRFHSALTWFLQRIPAKTRVVLYQTWPWQAGSRYLTKRAVTSSEMWASMQRAYAVAAVNPRIEIAPVGQCWMAAPNRAEFYSPDGNHASVAGSALAAAVLARTILRTGRVSC